MISIHRIVFHRLILAWLAVSLFAGGLTYFIEIEKIDDAIVALLAERAMYVKDATRFKRDAYQVSAPARQAEVFAKVRALATRHNRGFDALPDVAEAAYRALVAAFIANEQHYFSQTEPIGDQP